MKWNNRRNSLAYKADLKVLRDDELKNYYEHVIQIANTFSKDSVAIGILDSADLIQAGNVGLIEAWEKVDWELIEASPNPQGQLWSFLKKRIKFNIRQEIDKYGTFVKIPERILRDHKKNLTGVDKILVNTFPQFFANTIVFEDPIDSWENERLGEILDDMIYNCISSIDHRIILSLCYGLDCDKMSHKNIADKFRTTISNIQNIKHRCIKKLDTEENKEIIKNFYSI